MTGRTYPGAPYPLGASWDGAGVNFALLSESATAVELCLFEGPEGHQEVARILLTERTDQVWLKDGDTAYEAGAELEVEARSLMVLQQVRRRL